MLLLTVSSDSMERALISCVNFSATSRATSESTSAVLISKTISSISDAFIRPRERREEKADPNLEVRESNTEVGYSVEVFKTSSSSRARAPARSSLSAPPERSAT